jgi:acetyl-CoA C-acetyltransferase
VSTVPSSQTGAVDDRAPVLVGLGEVTARPGTTPAGPVPEFMARAVRAAALDAVGVDPGDGTAELPPLAAALIDAAEVVAVAPSATWPDHAPGFAVAAALGIEAKAMRSSMVGGNGSQLLVNELARRIQAGDLEVAIMCGAEALHSEQTSFESFGDAVNQAQAGEGEVLEDDHPGNSEAELEVGFALPVLGYALMEQAIGARAGRSVSEQQRVAAELWSRFSEVASHHPNAWVREARTAEEIATPTPANRQVSYPYTKLMTANFRVDESAALVLCSAGAARRLGIDESKWVYVHAGAQANDEWFVSERESLDRSPAIAACGAALFEHAGITAADLGPVDLYSCFPSAVQIAAGELGLPIDDPARPLTTTGGLTFYGGPGNNYGTHGVIGVARELREAAPGTLGVSSSLGWYATKHAYGLYGSSAPAKPYETLRPTPVPARREVASKEDAAAEDAGAIVEVATAFYGRDGAPQFGVVFALLADGRRAVGKITQPSLLAELTEDGFIGTPIQLLSDGTVTINNARSTTA